MSLENKTFPVCIIGAGPAGLTTAYHLAKNGMESIVLEADPQYVGGISKTAKYKGFHFDIGGHRFFSKSKEIEDLWTEILPNDMLIRPRLSRIFYRGNFFSYPLKPFDALSKLGIFESVRCVLSYFWRKIRPIPHPTNFEDWVCNQFGNRLFQIFFKTYTEKVWGMSCKEISADWAAQRIKGLSLGSAIYNALKPKKKSKPQASSNKDVIKTLIESFRYPRKGPGMMWEVCAEKIQAMGSPVKMGCWVKGCHWNSEKDLWEVTYLDSNQSEVKVQAHHVVSSTSMRELALGISPRVSPEALEAANSLRYRDFLTVMLILKDKEQFDDNWIYIHDPDVKVGRVQNFKSWSPEMVPDPELNCLGLEYFCFEGDGLWSSSDQDLIALAKKELAAIGLAREDEIIDGCVVRQPKAYPVYDDAYKENVAIIRDEIQSSYPRLHLVGRNGMHKYNNQDHAMMTGLLCAKNILSGTDSFDLWQVNQDAEYHEAGKAGEVSSVSGFRMVPEKVSTSTTS